MPQDKIDRLVVKAEGERRTAVIQKACAVVLAAVEQHGTPVTLLEIAQALHCPLTPSLAALMEELAASHYLTQTVMGAEVHYTLPIRQKSGFPHWLLPLPYYIYDQYGVEAWLWAAHEDSE